MQLTAIKECGSNNILLWAIQNGADLRSENELQQLINDQTYYSITLTGVNYLEYLRLVQVYRNKLRIINENKATMPLRKVTAQMFPGGFAANEENPDEKSPFYELAELSCRTMLDLALQMNADDDIILPSTTRLYLPMLTRTLDVQIPLNFIDLLNCIPADKDPSSIFNAQYPNNLDGLFDNEEFDFTKNTIMLGLVKILQIIRYSKKFDSLITRTKYAPLKKVSSNSLITYKMIGFSKYDKVLRNQVKCDMFNINKDLLTSIMKRLSRIDDPLKVEFAVQMPIQFMCDMCNSFSQEDLPIYYESSMADILATGLQMKNFRSFELEKSDSEYEIKLGEYNNAVEEYSTRISNANKILLSAINEMSKGDNDIDMMAMFSLLPTMYMTKAVITVSSEDLDKYILGYQPELAEMFDNIKQQIISLNNEINRMK